MIKIGIVGSLASGKTTVAKLMSHNRHPIFSADKTVKAFYKKKFFINKVKKEFNFKNTRNLKNICLLIKKHLPEAKIIFTLSPIPLMATFRPQSCITANSISKSILRVALDNVITKNYDNTYYFPAYEITKEYFIDPFGEDNRHLKDQHIKEIMEIFLKYYCV